MASSYILLERDVRDTLKVTGRLYNNSICNIYSNKMKLDFFSTYNLSRKVDFSHAFNPSIFVMKLLNGGGGIRGQHYSKKCNCRHKISS